MQKKFCSLGGAWLEKKVRNPCTRRQHLSSVNDIIWVKRSHYDKEQDQSEIIWTYLKQWPLDSEFVEFEYSPKIRHFWQIWVLAKMAFFGNVSDPPDSPTFAKPCRTDSPDSPTFAEPCRADSPDSPTFAEPCCADSPESRKASLARFMQI